MSGEKSYTTLVAPVMDTTVCGQWGKNLQAQFIGHNKITLVSVSLSLYYVIYATVCMRILCEFVLIFLLSNILRISLDILPVVFQEL